MRSPAPTSCVAKTCRIVAGRKLADTARNSHGSARPQTASVVRAERVLLLLLILGNGMREGKGGGGGDSRYNVRKRRSV